MLSLALSMILYGVLVKTETLGSTDGFTWRRRPSSAIAPHGEALGLALYWLVLAVCAVSRAAGRRSISARSPARWRCRSATTRSASNFSASRSTALIHIKLVIAGVLGGLGGALAALTIGHVDPDMAYWTTSGGFVFVTILAGAGSVAAAFVGSLVFEVGALLRRRHDARRSGR